MLNKRFKFVAVILSAFSISIGCAERVDPRPATTSSDVVGSQGQKEPAERKPEMNDATEPAKMAESNLSKPAEPLAAPVAEPAKPASVAEVKQPDGNATKMSQPEAATSSFSEAAYLPDELVGIVVAHTRRFFESPIGKPLMAYEYHFDIPLIGEAIRNTVPRPIDVERVTIALEPGHDFTKWVEASLGLQSNSPQKNLEKTQLKHVLKKIGLAFHNHHDVFQCFPRANGDGAGNNTGLSWRVHLLPYLDQAQLYNMFKLNEPWDSDHNKALIDHMPDFFVTPEVAEKGKTSFHVFTGENTPFHGDKGMQLRQFTDGTSNTILCVVAGADKAEFWTKPGGLEVDLTSPKKTLGEIKEDRFFVLRADGLVTDLPINIEDSNLARLIQPQDGGVIDGIAVDFETIRNANTSTALPTVILTLSADARQDKIIKSLVPEATEEISNGQTIHRNKTMSVWCPDNRTVIFGMLESVKKLISLKQSRPKSTSPMIEMLQLKSELTFAFKTEAYSASIKQLPKPSPILGVLADTKSIAGGVSMTGNEGESLVDVIATAVDVQKAIGLTATVAKGLIQGQAIINQQALPPNPNASDKEMNKILKQIAAASTVTAESDKIRIRIPATSGYQRVATLLEPTLKNERTSTHLK